MLLFFKQVFSKKKNRKFFMPNLGIKKKKQFVHKDTNILVNS